MKPSIKHISTIFFCLLLTAFPVTMLARESARRVWVAIRTVDRGVGQPTEEYYGTVDKDVLSGILDYSVRKGFVELREVSWHQKGKLYATDAPDSTGMKWGYSRTMYVRVETINRIFLLSKDFGKTPAADGVSP